MSQGQDQDQSESSPRTNEHDERAGMLRKKRAPWTRVLGLVFLLLGFAYPLPAQARWLPRLQLDNDVYNFWIRHTQRPDEQYSNGVRASIEAQDGSFWGRRFAPGTPDCDQPQPGRACRATRVTLGQDLFTPNLDRAPHTVPDWEDERPFFAWAYVTASARLASPRALRTVSLSLGVTGPPAGGELAQTLAHRIGFNDLATGWETQIGFEPGVMLEVEQSLLAVRTGGDRGLAMDLAPEGTIAIGNIRTAAALGGSLRVGWNLSHPWSPAEWSGRAESEWWLSAGGRAHGVARDMSLDGTWRDPERRVERESLVTRYEFGAGYRWKWLQLEYRAVSRSREYRTGPVHHAFSSMILSIVPWTAK